MEMLSMPCGYLIYLASTRTNDAASSAGMNYMPRESGEGFSRWWVVAVLAAHRRRVARSARRHCDGRGPRARGVLTRHVERGCNGSCSLYAGGECTSSPRILAAEGL